MPGRWLVTVFAVGFSVFAGGCESFKLTSAERAGAGKEQPGPAGAVQKVLLPECSGGFMLTVAGEVIAAEEVTASLGPGLGPMAESSDFEQFRRYARPQIERLTRARIAERILYRQASKELQDNVDDALEKAAEKEVKDFVASFSGNYAEAEKKLKEGGFDWPSFRQYRKKQILTQWYLSKQLKDAGPVTHSQLRQYYERIKQTEYTVPGQLSFWLIDIQPGRLVPADANEAQRSQSLVRARQLAEELVQRLKAGEDFGELARQYSHGHQAQAGGLWQPVQSGSLAEPYDVLEAACVGIEPGQIAGPIETREHLFILKLQSKRAAGYIPFEQVQAEIERKLLSQQRREQVERLLAKLSEQACGQDMENFVDFCLRRIYQEHH